MAKFARPIEFSTVFEVDKRKLERLGALSPALNVDTRLFIDPALLKHSRHAPIREEAYGQFCRYFEAIIKLLRVSTGEGDVAWREALRRLTVREVSATGLGYGAQTTHGTAIGAALASRILRTAQEIVALGIEDPEIFTLIPLLEKDMGPDRISDMTTRAILPALSKFTETVSRKLAINTEKFEIDGSSYMLPVNPVEKVRRPVVLVPEDILRDLPLAADWDGVAVAAAYNSALRQRVSALIGDIWEKEVRADRAKLRKTTLSSGDAIQCLLEIVDKCPGAAYDLKIDHAGISRWRNIRETIAREYPVAIRPGTPSPESAIAIVNTIISQYRKLIEKKGYWKELWNGSTPRDEKAAQRNFYAVADSYCEANNLDVTPEAETGNGPIDFKFSAGYNIRVLVEVKLSKNSQLVHGYEKQLLVYEEAEEPVHCIFLVIDVGKMGGKMEKIRTIRNDASGRGRPFADIQEIDGTRKEPASKRK